MKKFLLLCLLLVAITGCDDDNYIERTPAEQITDLETSGKLPVLDRSDDLLGPDEDNNGVRDDIDAYIDRVYTQPEQHAAVMQAAKVSQKYMTIDVADKIAVKKLGIEEGKAVNCAFDRFEMSADKNPLIVMTEIEAMTANTKKRLLAYLAVSKAASGMAFSSVSGDTCE